MKDNFFLLACKRLFDILHLNLFVYLLYKIGQVSLCELNKEKYWCDF